MVVDQRIVVETKATAVLPACAERQLLNYLRASTYQVGLLLHVGPTPEFKRLIDTRRSTRPPDIERPRSAHSHDQRHSRPNELALTSDPPAARD